PLMLGGVGFMEAEYPPKKRLRNHESTKTRKKKRKHCAAWEGSRGRSRAMVSLCHFRVFVLSWFRDLLACGIMAANMVEAFACGCKGFLMRGSLRVLPSSGSWRVLLGVWLMAGVITPGLAQEG